MLPGVGSFTHRSLLPSRCSVGGLGEPGGCAGASLEAGELAEHLRWHDDAARRAKVAADPEPVADGDELRAYLAGGYVVAVHEP